MSLFGSLFTGVSALSAQSQSIGMIANNIANVSTTGYKRNTAAFSALVTTSGNASRYDPGSVRASRQQNVDQQGALQQTASTTDLGISGNGFFVVQKAATGLQEPYYTRAGNFSENSQGFLVNASGFYLMGWPLDENGQLPASQADISSLEPIDVAFVGGFTKATSSATLALNLKANEEQLAYPISAATASQFSRGLRIYDSLGSSQDISFEFTKAVSPTANVTTSATGLERTDALVGTVPGMANGDDFTVSVNGAPPVTVSIATATTVQDLLDDLNAIAGLEARLTDNGEILLQATNLSENVVIANTTGTPATDLGIVGTATAPAAPTIFPAGGLENAANTQGWWRVEVKDPNSNAIVSGYVNFNGDGSLNGVADVDGEKKITLSNVVWGNGSDPQDIDIQIDRFTQFSGNYNVLFSEQNGAELGLRTGLEIDADGVVFARFSNGQSSALYKIPLATFTNENGLEEQTGVAYQETSASGTYNLREANQGGGGAFQSGALENSNVDLADEFSKMIVTQRAFSAGTKIITTVDELTEELLRLR